MPITLQILQNYANTLRDGAADARGKVPCSVCRGIRIEDVLDPTRYQLHANLTELRQCISRCGLCAEAYGSVRNATPVDWKEGDPIAGPWKDQCSQDQYRVMAVYKEADRSVNPGINEQALVVTICGHREEKPLSEERPWVYIWTIEGDPATRKDLRIRVSGVRPGRLIQVLDRAHQRLKLVNGSYSKDAYTALSYTWGSSAAPWKTTVSNLSARQQGFRITDLPKTLIHAVQVTSGLGIRFVWIDAICIVQDSEDDWKTEAVKMVDVYRNARLTIAADFSTGSTDRMFNRRSRPHIEGYKPFIITNTNSEGMKTQLYLDPTGPSSDWQGAVEHGQLSKRAWCCQEMLLSPRILHFAETQLFWECLHCIRSEDNFVDEPKRSPFKRTLLTDNDPEGLLPVDVLLKFWYSDVVSQDYSRRHLTEKKDKLVALAGVAKAIQSIYHLPYYAGLWEKGLIEGLCWSRQGRGRKTQAKEYRAPSWSWASQESEIIYFHYGKLFETRREHAQATITMDLDQGNEYGPIYGASMKLRAKALEGTCTELEMESHDYHKVVRLANMERLLAKMDDHTLSDIDVLACLILEVEDRSTEIELYFLLLQRQIDAGGEYYTRVGLAMDTKRSKSLLEAFEAAPLKIYRVL
ncbi:hypothetical protein LTR46_010645 [Exophiala xenobiotica]|nr:hypothetical protein LTR46_010645 [Exophiala xenobiotica]